MLATVAAVGELALATDNPVAYLVFPPLLWAALRFGQRGASLAILIAAGVVVWNTSHHAGPFHFHSISPASSTHSCSSSSRPCRRSA
jgi:integral membrane sensor domain MASE1